MIAYDYFMIIDDYIIIIGNWWLFYYDMLV